MGFAIQIYKLLIHNLHLLLLLLPHHQLSILSHLPRNHLQQQLPPAPQSLNRLVLVRICGLNPLKSN